MAAAQHYVLCKYCNEKFNRDKEPAIKVDARRYVHEKCYEKYRNNKSQEERDLEDLHNYIKKLFNTNTISARVKQQIALYKKEYKYTYSGMLKTLIWWFEIKGNSTDKANNGIGIVPYIYQDACNYYYTIFMAEKANAANEGKLLTQEVEYITIESPQTYVKPPKLFNI